VCVCVCLCVRARMRVRARVRVCACTCACACIYGTYAHARERASQGVHSHRPLARESPVAVQHGAVDFHDQALIIALQRVRLQHEAGWGNCWVWNHAKLRWAENTRRKPAGEDTRQAGQGNQLLSRSEPLLPSNLRAAAAEALLQAPLQHPRAVDPLLELGLRLRQAVRVVREHDRAHVAARGLEARLRAHACGVSSAQGKRVPYSVGDRPAAWEVRLGAAITWYCRPSGDGTRRSFAPSSSSTSACGHGHVARWGLEGGLRPDAIMAGNPVHCQAVLAQSIPDAAPP